MSGMFCRNQAVTMEGKFVCQARWNVDTGKSCECPYRTQAQRENAGFPCLHYEPVNNGLRK